MMAGAVVILLGACGGSATPTGEPTPGAKMTPGKWRFETEVVEMSSDKISDSELERMTNKPPVDERCIGPLETEKLANLFRKNGGDCTVEQDSIRDGIVRGRSQCRHGTGVAETRIDGSYTATTFDMVSKTTESGATGSDGNISLTMRAKGRRIGDC